MTISTGSSCVPSMLQMLPRCCICGKRVVVTRIGKGSISLAHTGSIPTLVAASGKPPEPSKSEPSLKVCLTS